MITADVIIIGGGIAGASAAFFTSETASTIVLEREPLLAYHSTGRSVALFVENYGGPVNERLAVASRPFFESGAAGYADYDLLHRLGYLNIGGPETEAKLREAADSSVSLIPDIEVLSGDEVRKIVPAIREDMITTGVWNPNASSIDVMHLHEAFLRGARANGAVVELNAPVGNISRTKTGWVIDVSGHAYTAPIIINAAGAWGDQLATLAGVEPIGLSPMRRTVFTVPTTHDTSGWPFVSHEELPYPFYFKPEAGNQLLCSPGDETPDDPTDAKPVDLDIARAIHSINRVTTLEVRSVNSSWAGLRTFAPDRSPVLGWDTRVEGFCWMVGQGGTGINTSPAAGLAVASIVTGSPWPDPLDEVGLEANSLAPCEEGWPRNR